MKPTSHILVPATVSGLLHALVSTTRDAITWKSYRAFRLPFGVTVAVGREWR